MWEIICDFAKSDPFSREYHDQEWCQITHDDQNMFELLVLETMQAGLSWVTILKKRKAFKLAFDDFDYHKVANYDEAKIESLLNNPDIIRNKLKINAAVQNANAFIKIQEEFGSFDEYIWAFSNNKQIKNSWDKMSDIPANSELSDQVAKDLKKRGFKFVGSTIVYSFLQAIGVVDDHVSYCFKNKE